MSSDAVLLTSNQIAASTLHLSTLTEGGNRRDVREAAQALIEVFGDAAVGGALQNLTLTQVGEGLKAIVNENDNLSRGAKEAINEKIDELIADELVAVDAAAAEAVGGSEVAETANDWAAELIRNLIEAMADDNDEKNSGNPETKAKSGGGGGGRSAEGGGEAMNWLVRMAQKLGEAQGKWLTAADGHLATMDRLSGNDDTQARDDFVQAQAKYTATMQMFSMTAAATSTSLKTAGEGMAGIARKQ